MLVVEKTENVMSLVHRQVAFLRAIGLGNKLDIRVMSNGYRYQFIPGVKTSYKGALDFLRKDVWSNPPLDVDEIRLEKYISYVASLASDLDLCIDIVLDILETLKNKTPTLVHGDACLENFITTETGEVIAIDPGKPRGFSLVENDLGKLLQDPLTHWSYIKFGACSSADVLFPVDDNSVASLTTHWVRILKNRGRHNAAVGQYGRVVIQTLVRSLESRKQKRLDRSRWDYSEVQAIHDQLLSDCHMARNRYLKKSKRG